MSEWFKEHDWKSCDGGDSSGGSNPLLCATQSHPLGVVFLWCREEAGRNDAGSREAQSAEALPRGPLWGFGKILEYDRHYAESATQSHPLGVVFFVVRRRGRKKRRRFARGAKRRSFAEGLPLGIGKIIKYDRNYA